MGCWGVEPFENDSACDWVAARYAEFEKIFKKITEAKDVAKACFYYAEPVRTAVEHLLALDPIVPRSLFPVGGGAGTGWSRELVGLAYEALIRIRYCERYVEGYRDPARFIASVENQLHRVNALCAREKLRELKPRRSVSRKPQKTSRLRRKKRPHRRAV